MNAVNSFFLLFSLLLLDGDSCSRLRRLLVDNLCRFLSHLNRLDLLHILTIGIVLHILGRLGWQLAGAEADIDHATAVLDARPLHRRHLLDLTLVLEVFLPLLVVTFLLESSLLVKQTLGEGVILALDTLGLTLPGDHVQRSWAAQLITNRLVSLLLDGWSH